MAFYTLGDNWNIPITLKKEGGLFDVSGATIEAGIFYVKGNTKETVIDYKNVDELTSGSDWGNGLIVADFTDIETAAITYYNNLFVSVKVMIGLALYEYPLKEINVQEASYISVPTLPFSDLCEDVFLELPDVPKALIEKRIQLTIRDFAIRTDAWHETTIITSTESESYSMYKSGVSKIHKIIKVTVDGQEIEPYIYRLDDDTIVFDSNYNYKPKLDSEIIVTLSMIPNSCECPDFFIHLYSRELIAGTIANLMMMPNRSWTNFDISTVFKKEYYSGVERELSRQISEGTYNSRGLSA